MGDDSWLLIRPSGTEPILRVYAEGRTQQMVKDLLGYGEQVAASVSELVQFHGCISRWNQTGAEFPPL